MKISVITISYNNLAGLERTMASVLAQTYADFEYLVIDGGSSDGSARLIESHSSRLAYGCSEPDGGIYNAMNKGVAHASGDYLLFLNSGDVLANGDVLARIAPELGADDIVYGDLIFRYTDPDRDFHRRYPDRLSAGFFMNDSLPHPASFIRRSLLVLTPYNESYRIVADWAFFLEQIVNRGCSYRHIPEVVAIFTVDGVSTDHSEGDRERRRVIGETFPPMVAEALAISASAEACGLTEKLMNLQATRKLRKRLRPVISGIIGAALAVDRSVKKR